MALRPIIKPDIKNGEYLLPEQSPSIGYAMGYIKAYKSHMRLAIAEFKRSVMPSVSFAVTLRRDADPLPEEEQEPTWLNTFLNSFLAWNNHMIAVNLMTVKRVREIARSEAARVYAKQYASVVANSGAQNVPPISQAGKVREAIAMNRAATRQVAEKMNATLESRLEKAILTAIKAGGSRADIEKRINETIGPIMTKALESDAVNAAKAASQSLFSEIAQAANGDLGIDEYLWQNQRDEKVRGNPLGKYPKAIPEHWYMQGIRCKWGDPNVMLSSGKWVRRSITMECLHPGQAERCRCFARGIGIKAEALSSVERIKSALFGLR